MSALRLHHLSGLRPEFQRKLLQENAWENSASSRRRFGKPLAYDSMTKPCLSPQDFPTKVLSILECFGFCCFPFLKTQDIYGRSGSIGICNPLVHPHRFAVIEIISI